MDNTLAPASGPSPVVIVVEDDAGLRVALLRMLRASGFRARAHDCGEALLEDARSDEADCLVVDVHLRGISGLDLVERLRQHGLIRSLHQRATASAPLNDAAPCGMPHIPGPVATSPCATATARTQTDFPQEGTP